MSLKKVFFILLGKDGAINRIGNGTIDTSDNSMFIGHTKEPLFSNLIEAIDENIFEYVGKYNIPEPKGKKCKLSLLFSTSEGTTGFEFNYGSKSQGPPSPIPQIVTKAVQLTNPWFKQQKAMVVQNKNS